MTPLPGQLGGGDIVFWRLDGERYASSWNSGEGAFLVGGRWNSRGVRAVYASLDPATAILEVAVHKGFRTLDLVRHVMTAARIEAAESLFVVEPRQVPVGEWLAPGVPGVEQQRFGDALLSTHAFVLVPSVVSKHSWNIVFDPSRASDGYSRIVQERFVLDPRLAIWDRR